MTWYHEDIMRILAKNTAQDREISKIYIFKSYIKRENSKFLCNSCNIYLYFITEMLIIKHKKPAS